MASEFPQIHLNLPIFDQAGKQIGWFACTPDEIMRVEGYVDDDGTTWVPPTAFAYAAVCQANRRKDEALTRAFELLPARHHEEVERLMRPPLSS